MIGRFIMVIVVVVCSAAMCAPAEAIVGGARKVGVTGQPIVMIVGARGNKGTLCTGTALTRELVLTAAHCVAPDARYQVIAAIRASMTPIGAIALHPRYDPQSYARGRVTADVALIKLAVPLPDHISPAALAAEREVVAAGDRLLIAGFGVTAPDEDTTTGLARVANLVVTGRPGTLQIRLVDPATRGERFGLGACTGDSGGPAFRKDGDRLAVMGVISWSTGPAGNEGCGGMTGVTPLTLYRAWIVEQAAKMGAAVR
jgi:secreted trypsin-like serine protease